MTSPGPPVGTTAPKFMPEVIPTDKCRGTVTLMKAVAVAVAAEAVAGASTAAPQIASRKSVGRSFPAVSSLGHICLSELVTVGTSLARHPLVYKPPALGKAHGSLPHP